MLDKDHHFIHRAMIAGTASCEPVYSQLFSVFTYSGLNLSYHRSKVAS